MTTSDEPAGDPALDSTDDPVLDPVDEHAAEAIGDSVAVDDPDEPDARRRSLPVSILRWVGIVLAAVAAIVLVLAIWPTSTGGLGAERNPTATHEEAVARFESITADEPGVVFEPCESVLLDHGETVDVAVVLFHGLTNCPKQFVEFAEELHADGTNVLILRAPRHGIANADGTGIGDLSNVDGLTSGELAGFADDAVDIATGLGEEVRVLGLSMGGVLSNWTAQERSDVDRVVVVAPAMSIPGVPRFLTTGFINMFNKLPPVDLPGESDLDHAYVGESTKGLVATFNLSRAFEKSADSRGPAAGEVIVVINPDDNQVDADYVRDVVESWGDPGQVTPIDLPFRGLRHDVIDPDQPGNDVDEVYPFLIDLLNNGV